MLLCECVFLLLWFDVGASVDGILLAQMTVEAGTHPRAGAHGAKPARWRVCWQPRKSLYLLATFAGAFVGCPKAVMVCGRPSGTGSSLRSASINVGGPFSLLRLRDFDFFSNISYTRAKSSSVGTRELSA